MPALVLYEGYSREDVKNILDPNANFTPGAGAWGLQGVINVAGKFEHFVFFVTYGREQSGHVFEEGITEQGILSWQSQPSQHLEEKRIKHWIQQTTNKCKISLFVRNKKSVPYIYMGQISYISHDPKREKPVWFKFQIDEWRYLPQLQKSINPMKKEKHFHEAASITLEPTERKPKAKKGLSSDQLKSLLDAHPELLGEEEGKELHFDYETTLGSTIPLVVHAPGKEKFVIMFTDSEHDGEVFRSAGRLIQYSVELAIELDKPINDSDIKRVLFLSEGDFPVTRSLARKYQIILVYI